MKPRFICRLRIHKYRLVEVSRFPLPSLGESMIGELTTRKCNYCGKVKSQSGRLINRGINAEINVEDLIAYRKYEEDNK